MHITEIELEDIKSHAHFKHEFGRGTTAITGENGAGKTTLIEAVAWALFDLLDYKKADFVRRGAKKGVVHITFESGLDGRQYRVYRDTGTGYHVYDPELKTRIAEKKDEVRRFLWQHLGLEPGTDLREVFRGAIGVPQGTFTADFLKTAGERKPVFDKLLRVEEYRKSSDELLKTVRHVDEKIAVVRESIAHAEGELARIETLEEEHKSFAAAAAELTATLEKLETEVQTRTETVRAFDKREEAVKKAQTALDRLKTEFAKAELIEKQKTDERQRAHAAAEKTEAAAADHQTHLEALGRIKELERERTEREKIDAELKRVETAQTRVAAEHKSVGEKLERSLKAHQEIRELAPQIKEQETLEKEKENLRNRLAKAAAGEEQIKSYDRQLKDLREKYKKNQDEIKEAEAAGAEAEFLEERQKREKHLLGELADFRARLEADQKFQQEIKNGLCPILSEKCLNMKEGQTLESFVTSQFGELKQQISRLETEQRDLAAELQRSREGEKALARLETLRGREREIGDEGQKLRSEKEALAKTIADLPEIKNELAGIETQLKKLDNPRAKAKLLEAEAENEINIRAERTKIEKNIERLENDHGILLQQLESYKFLDQQWREFTEKRDRTAAAHRQFLANEELAGTLADREKEYAAAREEVEKLKTELDAAEKDLAAAGKDYDAEKHLSERGLLGEAESRRAETGANLENARRRAAELKQELERLAKVRRKMQGEFAEKEKLERIGEATRFIRETLKEAAPQVAKNYVYHISLEANQIFREITGNAERTLKWTEDYGIVLEEEGHERPFQNLSGGEQMAAALAVRLALLKQLSEVRLAFFDEPTTNMDLERRERLAEQISQITQRQTFDQLFVISHDDTFETYVDNVVEVRSAAAAGGS